MERVTLRRFAATVLSLRISGSTEFSDSVTT